MVDMVLLLHGQSQPLSRIQPQLAQFFTEHYLQGSEPTEANITVCHVVYFLCESFISIVMILAVFFPTNIVYFSCLFLNQRQLLII